MIEFKITKPGNIKDKEVIEQLPADVVEKLGNMVGTGYDLKLSRRDVFFEHGLLQYNPYQTKAKVKFSDED